MGKVELRSVAAIERNPFDLADTETESGWALLSRLGRECVLPHWKILLITIAAMVASAVTAGALPLLLQRVADDIFVAKDARLLFVLPALVFLLMAFRAAAAWVTTVFEAHLGTKVVSDLRLRMFDAIAAADLAWIQRTHSGRFVSTFVNDTATVDRAATRVMLSLFRHGLSVIFLLGAMFYMDWRLSLIVLIGAPIALINLSQQRKRIRLAVRRSMQEYGDLGSMLTQTLQSMRVVKAYSQEEHESRRIRKIVGNLRKYLMKTTRSRAAVAPVSDALTGLGIAAAILYGGWQGIYGEVTLGHFTGFMAAAMLAFQPMKSLATTHATLSEGLIATSRVFALIDYTSKVEEIRGAKPLRVTGGAISFRNVSFGYDGGGPILSGFNLEIAAGQKVALVGRSGAGKSTVINLVLRFFDPSAGSIFIDGQDIREATLSSVRGASALLTQDPVLFDDTIAANIRYGSRPQRRRPW
jgi:subfamily B ATP-binding cassette protein MsbA